MGSALCDQEWVANRLGRSVRSIRNYVKRGLLKQQIRDGRPMYDREEIEQLAVELGTDFPALNRRSFIELQRRLTKLEQDMAVVRRSMEISDNPLRPSVPAAVQLYKHAVASLGAGQWALEEIEGWVEIFDRLDDAAMDAIGKAVVEDRPWEVFFRLCLKQIHRVSSSPDFRSSLALQELHKKLDQGRKKLRGVILVWLELHRGNPAELALQAIEHGLEAVSKRLSGKMAGP